MWSVAAPTNHTLGLEAAFELLTRVPALRSRSSQALLVYVSRGVLGSLFEPQQVMNVMAAYQHSINASVIVSAFGVASGEEPADGRGAGMRFRLRVMCFHITRCVAFFRRATRTNRTDCHEPNMSLPAQIGRATWSATFWST